MSESGLIKPSAPSELAPVRQNQAVIIAEEMVMERSRQFATERTRGIGWTVSALATDAVAFAAGVPQGALIWARDFALDVIKTPGCLSGFDDSFSRKYVGVAKECAKRVGNVLYDVTHPITSPLIWARADDTFREYFGLFTEAAILAGATYVSYRALRSWFKDQPEIINKPFGPEETVNE